MSPIVYTNIVFVVFEATHSNNIPPSLQGIMLKSQLFGRAVDLGSQVSEKELTDTDGAIILAKAVYKTDSMSKITTTFRHISTSFSDVPEVTEHP